MPAETNLEIQHPDQYRRFFIGNRREIAQILKQVLERHVLISAHAGGDVLSTSLLKVDEAQDLLVLDGAQDPQQMRRMLAQREIICSAQPERIKVQFRLHNAQAGEFQGGPAIVAPLPDELLRLQRREYFRLHAPAAHQLNCQIPVIDPNGKLVTRESRVLDISGGGLAVLVPPEGVELQPGMEFENCQLNLPDTGVLRFKLVVRNLFQATNRNGIKMLRAGCEFVGLPNNAATAIQRYILRAERERSARER